jgi:hypothetical protein
MNKRKNKTFVHSMFGYSTFGHGFPKALNLLCLVFPHWTVLVLVGEDHLLVDRNDALLWHKGQAKNLMNQELELSISVVESQKATFSHLSSKSPCPLEK